MFLGRIKWLVDDGQSVNLLWDLWIIEIPLSKWPTFVNMEAVESMCVHDLFWPGGGGGTLI